MTVQLKQTRYPPMPAQMDLLAHWICLFPQKEGQIAKLVPYGEVLETWRQRLPEDGRDAQAISADLPNASASRVSFATVKPEIPSFALLSLARKLVEAHQTYRPAQVGVVVLGFKDEAAERLAEAVMAALLAAAAELPRFKKKGGEPWLLEEVLLFGAAPKHRFARTFAEAEGNNLARMLATLPPSELTPQTYREGAEQLAREHGWDYKFYGIQELTEKGAGAFLAVAQGSPEPDAGIMHLRYTPKTGGKRGIALVGKGICFDTGGTNLKPWNFMLNMQGDMQGSAVALGSLLALTRLKAKFAVDCYLALATNHIGPKAYKPHDVVTASDGTTIEVVHTDAEGRMVLSDTLVMASEAKPKLLIDYATLTGTCKRSLGNAYSGVFTNRPEWLADLIDAGRESGERVWPFPIDEDYDEAIKSDIADIKQCAVEGDADHILATRFLSRFVKHDTPWLHIDMSAGHRKGGLAHVPSDFTGFGVRFTLHLLLDRKLV